MQKGAAGNETNGTRSETTNRSQFVTIVDRSSSSLSSAAMRQLGPFYFVQGPREQNNRHAIPRSSLPGSDLVQEGFLHRGEQNRVYDWPRHNFAIRFDGQLFGAPPRSRAKGIKATVRGRSSSMKKKSNREDQGENRGDRSGEKKNDRSLHIFRVDLREGQKRTQKRSQVYVGT